MHNLVSTIIAQTFMENPGKFHSKAFHVKFSLKINHDLVEGYRYFELALYAPANYVQVWVRNSWCVIPVADMDYDDDGDGTPKPGKKYDEGTSDWAMMCDHDSGWRDTVQSLVFNLRDGVAGFSGQKWFEIVPVETLHLPKKD